MPFVRPPHSGLRQWDVFACNITCVAQLLYMAGQLDIPFDTAAFDRAVGRQPNGVAPVAVCVQLLLEAVPTLRSVSVSHYSEEAFQGVEDARAYFRRNQCPEDVIDQYLTSENFAVVMEQKQAMSRLRQELPDRLQLVTCEDCTWQARRLLREGAVLCTAIADPGDVTSHVVMLVPDSGDNRIALYDPTHGLWPTSLDELIADGALELDSMGFTAYLMD